MTINELLALNNLTANDQIPIWDAEATGSTEPTAKITAQNFANAVKSLASLIGTDDLDATPTQGSTKAVQSGGVFDAIAQSTATLQDEIDTLNSNLTQYIDLTTRLAPSEQFDLVISKVYRLGNRITGVLKPKSGASLTGTIYTIGEDIRPKCTRAMFAVYSFTTGLILTTTSIWIDGNGNLVVYGQPFDGNHACFVDYMI